MRTFIASVHLREFLDHAGPSTRRNLTSSAFRWAAPANHYEALRLPKNATKQQVKARFYELSKKYHPDAAGGDTSKFHQINDAYAILGDESKRRTYDQSQSQTSHHLGSSPLRPHATGPHRSWGRTSPRRPAGPATSGAHYNPFGRRAPHASGGAASAGSAYARAAPDPFGRTGTARRKGGLQDGDEVRGESGLWRFGLVVGLLMAVVSFGGGLTASADTGKKEERVRRTASSV